MRTTVTLDDDVYEVAQAHARLTGQRLGRVLSDMARQALQPTRPSRKQRGRFPTFDVPPGSKIPVDGGTPVLVKGTRPSLPPALKEFAYGASVSPDGRSLAFLYFTQDPKAGYSATDVVVTSLDGQIVKRFLYDAEKTGRVRGDNRVQWSRDGGALYYEMNNLWRRSLTGESLAQVTHFEGGLGYFDWSFDGKTLAWSRSAGQSDVVMITNFH